MYDRLEYILFILVYVNFLFVGYMPIFRSVANRLVGKVKEIAESGEGQVNMQILMKSAVSIHY